MKRSSFLLMAYCLLLISIVEIPGCQTPDAPQPDSTNPPPGSGNGSLLADTLSNRLLLLNAAKIEGAIPSAPANNALKISFRDTLYLTDQLPRPIKFLHTDPTQNVAGVFIQIGVSASKATHYYDVPEMEAMKESDSVSVIVIAIDPADLEKPQTGDVTIVPYDQNKQPITQITRPLKLDENRVDLPPGSGNGCGLTLPSGMAWRWILTIRADDLDKFWNEPNKVHSPQGQDITGACCNGISRYPLRCPGDTSGVFDRKLHFATYYVINFETFQFFDNGTFFRQTMEDSPVPLPSQSDFCAGGSGVVQTSLKHTTYEGNWTVTPANLPPNFPFPEDSLQLTLQGTSSSGTGFGNPGGVIHILDCKQGSLVLIQPSREGDNAHLVKFYNIKQPGENPGYEWYNPIN